MSSKNYNKNTLDTNPDLGILGFAYTLSRDNIQELQWLRLSNGKYEVICNTKDFKDFILHHTLDSNATDYDSNMLTLEGILKNE